MYDLPSTLEIFKKWNTANQLSEFIRILNEKGIILDEENTVQRISRNMFENWKTVCTSYLVENGYNGGINLSCIAFEIKERGFVYALYDMDLFEIKDVKTYIENYNYSLLI
ncbi:MAG: hypothetical protein HC854_07790 [Flavobacterium sp.]|nr:hypothetical protein [Flavobacterium sp.]